MAFSEAAARAASLTATSRSSLICSSLNALSLSSTEDALEGREDALKGRVARLGADRGCEAEDGRRWSGICEYYFFETMFLNCPAWPPGGCVTEALQVLSTVSSVDTA